MKKIHECMICFILMFSGLSVSAETPINNDFVCIPTGMIDYGKELNTQLSDLCNAKKINAKDGLELKTNGCAKEVKIDETIDSDAYVIDNQMRLELKDSQISNMRDCDFSDIAIIVYF